MIRAVDCRASSFIRSLDRIKDQAQQTQVRDAIRSLLMLNLDQAPRALHLHQLTGKRVASSVRAGAQVAVWTFHITKDDSMKASFTFEDGVAFLRLCGPHDMIDKNP